MRRSRKKRAGRGRLLHRLRNPVEGGFSKLKNGRRPAARCRKTAESFLSFTGMTPVCLWPPHLPA